MSGTVIRPGPPPRHNGAEIYEPYAICFRIRQTLFKRNYLKYNKLPHNMQTNQIVDLSSNILILMLAGAILWYALTTFAF